MMFVLQIYGFIQGRVSESDLLVVISCFKEHRLRQPKYHKWTDVVSVVIFYLQVMVKSEYLHTILFV